MGYRFSRALPTYLADEQKRVEQFARDAGLDFYPTLFEVLAYDQMNEIAAYGGFPTRYPHWRFGMEFERLKKSTDYGLSKIYELVINNNPSIAYLLEGNSLVDQKLVMAHVYGHVDFFKNNFAFSATDQGKDRRSGQAVRKWIDTMANHGSIIRKWAVRIGIETVEEFIDACLRLENLIDPNAPFTPSLERDESPSEDELHLLRVERDYMESFINPDEFVASEKARREKEKAAEKQFPVRPERDVLGFLVKHAPLERWERDVLTAIRREAYYFLPQMQTKIMNEGWASYWHAKLMTEKICDGSEIVDYAERNASVMSTANGQLNPYKLGVELYRHIESRWDKGQFGREWDSCDDFAAREHWDRQTGLGHEKIFEVRKLYTDVTFIAEFLTPEFALEQKLYAFGFNERKKRMEIESRTFEDVKKKLLAQLTNAGNPIIRVQDANHQNRGELLLTHEHHGMDLKLDWGQIVLSALFRVWKRPIEVHTLVDGDGTRLRYDGHSYDQTSL